MLKLVIILILWVTVTFVSSDCPIDNINIGGLINSATSSNLVRRGIVVGGEFVNLSMNVENGTFFNVTVLNSGSSTVGAYNAALELFTENSCVAIVGPHSSAESVYVSANLLDSVRKPVISYASTSITLSDKTVHPYFFRVVPPDSQQMEAIVDLCYSMNLNNLGILASSDPYGSVGAQQLVEIGARKGIKAYSPQLFSVNDPSTVRSQLRGLSDLGARVFIVIAASEYTGSSILEDADSQNLLTSEYTWIFSETFGLIKNDIVEANDNLYRRAQGVLYVDLGQPSWSKRQYLLSQWAIREELIRLGISEDSVPSQSVIDSAQVTAATVSSLSTYSAYAYDAVLTLYYAIQDVLSSGGCVDNGDELSAAISRVDFLGATGRVQFDKNNDRLGVNYAIYNIQGSSATQVATWNLQSGYRWAAETVTLTLPGSRTTNTTDFADSSILASNTWYSLPAQGTQPEDRHTFSATASETDNNILLFGGTSGSGPLLNDLWRYDFKTSLWSELYPLGSRPVARREHVSFRFADKYYIFSGFDGSAYLNDMHVYDLANNAWRQISFRSVQVPSPRRRAQLVQFEDTVYVVGGQDPQKENNDVWQFNVTSLTWTELFSTKSGSQYPIPRFSHCLVRFDDFIVMATGRTFLGGEQELDDLWAYNTVSQSWRRLSTTNKLLKRYDSSCTVRGSSMYLLAGYSAKEDVLNMNDLWSIDLSDIANTSAIFTWREIYSSIPNHLARDSTVLMGFGEYIVWTCGWGLSDIFNDFWSYNTVTETLRMVYSSSDSPVAATMHSMVRIGNNLVVYGGKTFNNVLISSLTVYNVATQEWSTQSIAGTLPPVRFGHTAISKGDQMFVFGGESATGEFLNDIWMYSLGRNQWTLIVPKSDRESGQLPSPRTLHTATSSSTHMFLFGGKTKTASLRDAWSFSFDTYTWTLLYDSVSFPQQSISCRSSLLNNTHFIVSGCVDDGDAPAAEVLSFNVQERTWSTYGLLPQTITPTTGHALVSVTQNHHFWFGGRVYTDLNNILYQLRANEFSPLIYSTVNGFPDARDSHAGVFLGSSLLYYGGTGTIPGRAAKVENTIFNQLWSYSIGPICSNFTEETDTKVCVPCSLGTYEYRGQCIECPTGQFSEELYSTSCRKCPAGFYGIVSGAQSRELCIPCAYGTYNDIEGQASCKTCIADQVCPIGATAPLTAEQAERLELDSQPYTDISQPTPVASADLFIRRVTIFSFVAAGSAAAIVALAILFIWFAKPSLSPYLQLIDLFYSAAHNSELTIMQKRKTEVGGIFTVLALVLVIAVLITEICTFRYNNRLETRSLIPNLSIENNKVINSTVVAKLTLVGYTGDCTYGTPVDAYGPCADGISVELDNLNGANTSLSNTTFRCMSIVDEEQIPVRQQQCLIEYTCSNCYITTGQDTAQMIFLITSPRSYAEGYIYDISSTTGYLDASYKTTSPSRVKGHIYSEPTKLFRGTISPTVLDLQTVQTTFVITDSPGGKTGFHLDYREMTIGDQVDFRSFNHRNGLAFNFRLLKAQYALEIVRYPKRTWMTMITDILSQFTGLVAGVAVAMGIFEMVLNRLREVHNKREPETPYLAYLYFLLLSILVQLPLINKLFTVYGPDEKEFSLLTDTETNNNKKND